MRTTLRTINISTDVIAISTGSCKLRDKYYQGLLSYYPLHFQPMSIHSIDKNGVEKNIDQLVSEIDLLSFHELHAGRLVIDPGYVQARAVSGDSYKFNSLQYLEKRKLNLAGLSHPSSS